MQITDAATGVASMDVIDSFGTKCGAEVIARVQMAA